MSKRNFVIALIVALGASFVFRKEIKSFLFSGKRTINTSEVKLLLTDEYSIDSLATILVENQIIKSKKVFINEAQNQNLSDTSFDAGKYIILSGTKIADLVEGFSKNEFGQGKSELKVNVEFNRCKTIEDIGKNISQYIQADSASLVDYIKKGTTLNKYNFTLEQIPALFLPDRYEMYYDTDPAQFMEFMANQFKLFWNEDRLTKMKSIGLSSPSQVTTLASIVYSEQSRVAEEWPIIARLYLNRIKTGMLLKSDPTFKFCWGESLEGVNRLLAKHRQIDCPYNTYKYQGLPPGPIYITPAKVIDAALSPANVDYLFMCAKPDYSGGHNFTASDVTHMRNASEYQRWLGNEQRKK